MTRSFFITGSDTGVGKTVLTVLLTRHLRACGIRVRAVKPLCSGGREDATALHAAQDGDVQIDEINPWHFRSGIAPLSAARREKRTVRLADVRRFLREVEAQADVLLIEGAGGLLSPLGEGFDARDLIVSFWARPLVVVPDKLGAINQALLVTAALPPAMSPLAHVILNATAVPDHSTRSNLELLSERIGKERVHRLPRLTEREQQSGRTTDITPRVRQLLDALLAD